MWLGVNFECQKQQPPSHTLEAMHCVLVRPGDPKISFHYVSRPMQTTLLIVPASVVEATRMLSSVAFSLYLF